MKYKKCLKPPTIDVFVTHSSGPWGCPVVLLITALCCEESLAHGGLPAVVAVLSRFPIQNSKPIGSMYGIFTYIWLIFMVNVGIYTIHGWYGKWFLHNKSCKSSNADALKRQAFVPRCGTSMMASLKFGGLLRG